MDEALIQRIQNNPKFAELVHKKGRLSWCLSVVMLVIYYGFILTIAFSPETLGKPLSAGGVTTVGIPVGLFVIVSAFVLTGIYVRRANTEFDQLTKELVEESRQ
ncbi:Uncharacterized membrane protein, DUF485 family [Andreprevotia lacus DSM 23236]|jgi:uncharacterized membrane protein (DUF485 family)|uniref:Uncharacterized membrane protein, DUF485 family n=1 Tax=Andreprevotia lacus DSM 23236 TaxID=1121001 RepID=A0A1W1XRN5_9NEIS|nr:DUF485 domain-containing protein [Andreprevotia lacus]SMC26191.1 Uncharacterized membrane protein, DUF485 family [Andreprevotia lacus DSM 23236]